MEPGIDSAPAFHLYSRLPCELRLYIIEQFLLDLGITRWAKYTVGCRIRTLAKYATVDRQWQAEVEKLTFECLRLRVTHNSTDLDNFEQKCVGDRINLVSRIRLTIELEVAVRFPDTPPSIMTVHDGEMHPSTLQAGQKATEVFCRLFRILQKWTRKGQLLGLTYRLERTYPEGMIDYSQAGRCVTRLAIDSSRLPEVPCVGSFRDNCERGCGMKTLGIQPASACQLLSKLPNVTHTDVNLQACLELPNVVDILEGQSTLSLQRPRLKHLTLTCNWKWCRRLSLEPSSRSLQLNQSIYAMTCRLEEVRLINVVNAPSFLRDSCGANGSTSQSPPAWPKLKKLSLWGSTSKEASNGGAVKEELHDSFTQALRQMPNLTDLMAMEYSEYHRENRMIWIQVPPRRDRSAMPDAKMGWNSAKSKPERETLDTWRDIVRRQWHCGLVPDPGGCLRAHWAKAASPSLYHDPL